MMLAALYSGAHDGSGGTGCVCMRTRMRLVTE